MFGTVFAAWYTSPSSVVPTVPLNTRTLANRASRAAMVSAAIRAAAPSNPAASLAGATPVLTAVSVSAGPALAGSASALPAVTPSAAAPAERVEFTQHRRPLDDLGEADPLAR